MLIAIKYKGTVYIAQSVSERMSNTDKTDMVLDENIPFCKVNGEKQCYVAGYSKALSTDALMNEPGMFKGIETSNDVLTKTIPKMRSLLSGMKLIDIYKRWNNALVIVKDNKIYYIDNYFVLIEIDEFIVAAGDDSRDNFITAGLECEKELPAEERIKKVIHSYNELHSENCFPIVLHNCTTSRKKILWGA